MVIEIYQRSPESREPEFVKITFDGRQQFYVEDGEPEDNNLSRNFAGCFMIKQMLEKVHEAGLRSELIEYRYINVD